MKQPPADLPANAAQQQPFDGHPVDRAHLADHLPLAELRPRRHPMAAMGEIPGAQRCPA